MDDNQRVTPIGKHNYYMYYEIHKHICSFNYQEKKRKKAEDTTPKDYYFNYFKNCEWKKG